MQLCSAKQNSTLTDILIFCYENRNVVLDNVSIISFMEAYQRLFLFSLNFSLCTIYQQENKLQHRVQATVWKQPATPCSLASQCYWRKVRVCRRTVPVVLFRLGILEIIITL